ncbi:hypothetical protein [Deinococcus multiflagellatus]|uniref:Uncharacterized protein n=1 Tax=Deinococcus multiflagellatus TaxID=1656887 RepID=A0ABW1ZGR0_9DEIO
MRALSLSRPWTTAIELHGKRTENRTRWTDHPHLMAQAQRMVGEDLALHSSGTYDKQGALYVQRHTGVLYGRKDTADKAITSVARVECLLRAGDPCPPGQEAWYFGDTALLLANVRVLPEPVWVAGAWASGPCRPPSWRRWKPDWRRSPTSASAAPRPTRASGA